METNENHKTTYLEELSNSNFEIAAHQPDITGWEITDENGNELGEVLDLIFDSNALKVRYIVAGLYIDGEKIDDDRMVLIPIGVVELDEDEDEVILPLGSIALLATLPQYEPGKTISPAEELAIRYAFLGDGSLPDANAVVYEQHTEDFYNHGHFDDGQLSRRGSGTDI